MRTTTLAVLTLFATSVFAQSPAPAPAPPAQPPAKETAKAPATPPDAVRKLSRRERKDKMAKLPDQYRQFLIDVEPIIQESERDTFLLLETDPQRELYINEFWRRRDLMQGTSNGAFRDAYYDRLNEVKSRFKQVSSDQAKMFLLYGEPNSLIAVDCSRYLQPLEIWNYFYIKNFGHEVRFLFYLPRQGSEYKLWRPMGDTKTDYAELISQDAMGQATTPDEAVRRTFFESASNSGMFLSKIQWECQNGDEILRAIGAQQQNKIQLLSVYEPPKVNDEDVGKILRSVVLATPGAAKLDANFNFRFPAKQGAKTDAEITIMVPRAQLTPKQVGEVSMYSVDVTGEVLRNEQLYESYRYRFDFPADVKDEKLPIIIDRFLRPGEYRSRIRISDIHTGAEAILENDLKVPEIFDTPEQIRQKEAGASAVAQLKDEIESNETRLRIVPLPEELLSGIQKIETMAVGTDIKAVEFYLDGKKIAVKRQPPFTLDLDFGQVPQVRKIRALALDAQGNVIAGDDIVVNTGSEPFRVRIVNPRAGVIRGRTRVEMSVVAPEGKEIEAVELYLNETKMTTLHTGPWVQSIDIPAAQGVGYIRAVAKLKDPEFAPVEDVVMINTPGQMETIDVHLIELPTTVLVNGKPFDKLQEAQFKVLDEGKPVKISKFEHVKNLPLSIGMAVDTSGSMQPKMSEAQKAAAQFFQNVMKPGDKAFLVGFDSQPQLVQKWSPRISDMHASLAKLRAEEYTALYDAVVYSLYRFLGVKGQRALIVLSDGKDTASKFTYDQMLEYARRAAVPIYIVGIGIRSTEVDVKFKAGRVASETGGAVYYIDRAEDLRHVYDDIQNELRSQYLIGFYPPEGVKPGSKWREVTVQTAEGKAKTIKGYYP